MRNLGAVEVVLVDEVEVDLLLEEVDALDADVDGVTELIAASMAAADDLVVVFVEHVVVVLQRADGYHALALAVFDLGVDAPLADAADEGGEYLPQFVGEVLGLLVLDAGAFGVGGFLFHNGTMLACLFDALPVGSRRRGEEVKSRRVRRLFDFLTF